MAWALECPGSPKLTRFQINTKSVKANMMDISVESLSLRLCEVGGGGGGGGASIYFGHISNQHRSKNNEKYKALCLQVSKT